MLLFSNVNTLKANEIRWNDIKYNRHNANYSGIINICYLILNDLLMTFTSSPALTKTLKPSPFILTVSIPI